MSRFATVGPPDATDVTFVALNEACTPAGITDSLDETARVTLDAVPFVVSRWIGIATLPHATTLSVFGLK